MDDIENPFIDKAIKQAKILRMLVLKMNERDKDIKDKRDEAEAELQVKKDSTDYPAEVIDTFFKEADYQEKVVADWEPQNENEEILFICDRIIYKLMAYDNNDKWFPEADYEERTQLKLKEIVKITMK
jgi:hypothetical protein